MTVIRAGVVVVTDRRQAQAAGRTVGETVAAALAAGADAVLLREKDLRRPDRARLAGELRSVTAAAGAELWVASDVDLAVEVGADAVHLAAADPWPPASRAAGGGEGPDGEDLRRGRSCHTVADLVAARRAGADHVTYSPVFATASKPGYGPPLGLDGLAGGCRAVPGLPVIALGGIGPGRVRDCVTAGAAGVALMGAVMAADDPATVVAAMVDELEAAATGGVGGRPPGTRATPTGGGPGGPTGGGGRMSDEARRTHR